MFIRLSACALAFAVITSMSSVATMACSLNDYACQKFTSKRSTQKASQRRRRPIARVRKKTKRSRSAARQSPVKRVSVIAATPANAATSSSEPSIKNVATSLPLVNLTRLQPGAINEPPKDLPNLIFGSGDQIEVATAKCNPVERSNRRVSCAVAVHRLSVISAAGAGCTGSLGLSQIEFVKDEAGSWVSEDSIALCGGRLLRRTELIPVSIDNSRRYALSEEYQMLGGDRACAAPYLRSRRPLRKAYMPVKSRKSRALQCGTVASR